VFGSGGAAWGCTRSPTVGGIASTTGVARSSGLVTSGTGTRGAPTASVIVGRKSFSGGGSPRRAGRCWPSRSWRSTRPSRLTANCAWGSAVARIFSNTCSTVVAVGVVVVNSSCYCQGAGGGSWIWCCAPSGRRGWVGVGRHRSPPPRGTGVGGWRWTPSAGASVSNGTLTSSTKTDGGRTPTPSTPPVAN